MRLRAEEWVPWDIDLDDEGAEFRNQSIMGSRLHQHYEPGHSRLVEGQGDEEERVLSQKSAASDGIHRLSSHLAQRVAATTGVGSVHTPGSLPPWKVSRGGGGQGSSYPTGPPIGPTLPAGARVYGGASRLRKALNPNRVGAKHLRQKKLDALEGLPPEHLRPGYLPKFGRVFNAGPRSATRKEFLSEKEEEEKLGKRGL